MSLIGDALEEAGRGGHTPPRQTTRPLGGIIIPPPRHRHVRTVVILGIAIATAACLVAGSVFVAKRHRGFAAAQTASGSASATLTLVPSAPEVVPPTHADILSPTPPVAPAAARDSSIDDHPSVQPVARTKATGTAAHRVTVRPPASPATPTTARVAPVAVQQGTSRSAPANPRQIADSLFRRAYAAHVQKNLDTAQALYEKVIATRQAPAAAYNDYGVLLEQRGNSSAAQSMFRQAISHDDTNADAWVNLGDLFVAAGKHTDALTAFARASQLDPGRAAIATRVASEYRATGDSASARQFFERAVALDPREPSTHYALAKFFQDQRDFAGAVREYQRFVDLAGDRYPAATIAEVKQHIVALRPFAR